MKKALLFFLVTLSVTACQKRELPQSDPALNQLRSALNPQDYAILSPSSITRYTDPKSGKRFVRAGFTGRDALNDFVILLLDEQGKLIQGRFVKLQGNILKNAEGKMRYSGSISSTDLAHDNLRQSAIREGFIEALHQFSGVAVNSAGGVRVNKAECADCTLPEVIVGASYSSSGYDWTAWLSMLWLFDNTMPVYIPVGGGSSGGGGGGSSYTPPSAISIDTETPENKDKIDAKKYMDCFGNIPNTGATCTITISTDIPVDGHPEILFDWSEGSPGHAFIELYKQGQNGVIVSQNIGFYPYIGFTVLGGTDVPSKVVDNGYHEYNARYTLAVSPEQLQAAIDKVNAISGNSYNMTNFNCVDFALAVFNAATAGALTIPLRQIPGYNTPHGSNTPQGLYERLDELKSWGAPGIDVIGSKAYGGSSKGPCN